VRERNWYQSGFDDVFYPVLYCAETEQASHVGSPPSVEEECQEVMDGSYRQHIDSLVRYGAE